MVTDYDCWRGNDDEAVDVPKVMKQMKENVQIVRKLFVKTIELMASGSTDWEKVIEANKETVKSSIVHQ